MLNMPAAMVRRLMSDLEKRGLVRRTSDQEPLIEVLLKRAELPRLQG